MRVQSNVGHEHHGIDLAPMLDFAINLLIFFLITAVFVKESGLNVRRPTSVDEGGAKPAPTVAIFASGAITIDGRPVDPRAVRPNIERIRVTSPNAGVVIVAEARAPTGTLVGVIDDIHLGGIDDITFSTTE